MHRHHEGAERPRDLLLPRLLGAIAATALVASTAAAQNTPLRIAASSFATVEVHLNSRPIGSKWYEEDAALTGPARIAITYGQPHARGRKIIGGLIPIDTVWRFGANESTTLHTDLDISLGTLAIPRGDYSLFLLKSADKMELIVNGRTAAWGTDRDAKQDIGRVPLTFKTFTDKEETLTIYLVPDSTDPKSGYATLGGLLRIRWGNWEAFTKWTVKQ